ncbi:MAG: glucose-1-phosphate adenylyltransferase subunit GlgD [Firmicutes bacterium]|nr:glucose-1-phosphate adenylyltransferase subunit GlgD [Bacillota bacterium]
MKALGIILAGGRTEQRLKELTEYRAAAALPVGGSYRAIDFSLSNMANSGINKVAIITQYNSRSLHDLVTSSKWWDFGRKKGGLFVFSPYISRENSNWFQGTADAIYQNMIFLERSNENYVVIASGDAIYRMDYEEMIDAHIENGNDITVAYKDLRGQDLSQYGIMELDEKGRITDFEEKPIEPITSLASMGIYVISRRLLIELLKETVPEGRYDLVKDIIIRYRKKLRICGWEFKGYWRSIGSGIMSYYNTNMDFLNREIRQCFTQKHPYIDSKPKDEPPVKVNSTASVQNCIMGCGTIVNGEIKDSVIFRKVYIGSNTKITNSIVMEDTKIGSGCTIEYAIIDKDVEIGDGKQLCGKPEEPIVLKKGLKI